MICYKCGKVLKDDDMFCSACGTRVSTMNDGMSEGFDIDKSSTAGFHVDEIRWDINGYPKEEVKPTENANLDWSLVVDERARRIAERNRIAQEEPAFSPVVEPEEIPETIHEEEPVAAIPEEPAPVAEIEEDINIEDMAELEAPTSGFVPEFKREIGSHTMEILEEPAPEKKAEINLVSLEDVFEEVEPPKEADWKKDATVRISMDRKKAMKDRKPARFTQGESVFTTTRGVTDEDLEDVSVSENAQLDEVGEIVPPLNPNKAGSIFYTGQDNDEIGAATQVVIPTDTGYIGTNTFVARKDIADAIQDVSAERPNYTEDDLPRVSRDTYDDLEDIEDTPRQRLLGGIMGWGNKIKSLGSHFDDDDDDEYEDVDYEDLDEMDDDYEEKPRKRAYVDFDDLGDDDGRGKSKFRSFLDKITGLDVEKERAEETGYNRYVREGEKPKKETDDSRGEDDMFLSDAEREARSKDQKNKRAHISPVRPAVKAGVVTAGISRNTAVQDFERDIAEASAGGITNPVDKKRNPNDKFYTFNQKSEEFRALLDEEYERLRQRIKDESEPGISAELEARMNSYVPRRDRIKEQEELEIQEIEDAAVVGEAEAAAEELVTEEPAMEEPALEEPAMEEPAEENPVAEVESEVQPEEIAAEEVAVAEEPVAEVESEVQPEEEPEAPAPVVEEEEEEEEEFVWTDLPDEDIDVELASAETDVVEPDEDEVVIVNDINQIIPEKLDENNLTQTGKRRERRTLLQDIFANNERAASEEPAEDDYNQIVSEETEKELIDFERRIDQMESEFESETGIERKKLPSGRKSHTFAPAIPTGQVDAEERIRRTAMEPVANGEIIIEPGPDQIKKGQDEEKPLVYVAPVKREKNLYKEEPTRNSRALILDILIGLLLIGIILVSILVFGRNTGVGQKLQEILGLKPKEVVEEIVPEEVRDTGTDANTETETQEPVLSDIETAIKDTKDRNTGIGEVAEDTALKFDPEVYYGFDGLVDAEDFKDHEWYSTDSGEVVRIAPALIGAAQEYYSKLLDRMNTGSDDILEFLDDTTTAYWNAAEYLPEEGVEYEFPKLQIGEIRQSGDIYYMMVRLAQKSNLDENLSTKVQIMQFNTEYNELDILNVLDVE